jgi:hypothetical protein
MNEEVRMMRLSVALKVISLLFIGFFAVFAILVTLDAAIITGSSFLASIFRWQPHNKAYEGMISSIYIVWGIMLWRASRNPIEHKSLIEFTIWGNAAHGAVMLISAVVLSGELIHIVSDVLLLPVIAGVLYWLRPRS